MEYSQDLYFAQKDASDVAGVCLKRANSFYNFLNANAFIEKLNRMWRFYHGAFSDDVGYGHQVGFTGEQGELVNMPINHFRNLAQHIHTMITSNRPIMEARASNMDYKSLAQTYVANGILDYYMREKRLEDSLKKACEYAIVLGAGFIKLDWNATAGRSYDTDPESQDETLIYEGDIEFTVLSPLDIVIDGTKENWSHDWMVVRTFQNRFNLMAKYPELAEKLKALQSKNESSVYRLAVWSNDETDDIPVYEFYHKRTEAMPDGRYILFASPECILLDTAMPYREIPVYRIAPADILGTPYGYTPMFDIFPIQEGLNSLYSSVMTNQNAFGVQNVFVPKGSDISISKLEGSLNVIEGTVKPEPLNLTETPAEVFKFIEMLIQSAETISGVNSVARGNPEASLKSGAALALVQSMAIQFISGLQQSYVRLIEDVGTGVINILKDFATTPKMMAIVGRNNKTEMKEFTGDEVSSISRVIVDVGNALSRTTAGRVQMAEQLLQMNLIKNPQQYFQVINTGRLDAAYDGEMQELLLIKNENEKMMNGESVIALAIDEHRAHILEHRSVLADPDLRRNNAIVQHVLGHIQEHIMLLRSTDPDLLQLIGEQPLQPPPPVGNPDMGLPPGPQNPEAMMGGEPQPSPQEQPPSGNMQAGEDIMTPNGAQPLPSIPQVSPDMLVNPGAQEAAMGNVRQ